MAKNKRADQTVLSRATPISESLKTTVPAFIVSTLGLKKGTIVRWKIESDRQLAVEIRRKGED
jgi:hypothetical protein